MFKKYNSKKILRKYRTLLIESERWTIRIKKLEYKRQLMEYWRLCVLAKEVNINEFEAYIQNQKDLETKFNTPKERIHV